MRRRLRVAAGLALLLASASAARPAGAEDVYDVLYEARLLPTERAAHVEIRVRQRQPGLRALELRIDPERHAQFEGDGSVSETGGLVAWQVPAEGGSLRFVFRIDHLRDDKSYDARCATQWAIFRGDDLVPPALARTRPGARSRARLRLRLPEGWSAATPFPKEADGSFLVEVPGRRFQRPTGWMVAARRLGVVREKVEGVQVSIAAPEGQDLRRLDLLALLRWTLPDLRELVPTLPDRLLVVGAGDPMWRGGLSGPRSVFIHSARPLIAGDTTSPMLHELMHTVLPRGRLDGDDWLVEGMAEYYSLELLRRSRTISRRRFDRALARLIERGAGVASVRQGQADVAVTARGVGLLIELDALLRERTAEARSLDDVVQRLVESGEPLSTEGLRAAAEGVAGESLERFFARGVLAPR